MKRSKMVKVLQRSILNHFNCYQDCCGSDDEMYSKILQELEDAGIEPPYSGGSLIDLNEWEDENE